MSWSPSGFSGGLLAAATSDHRALVYGPCLAPYQHAVRSSSCSSSSSSDSCALPLKAPGTPAPCLGLQWEEVADVSRLLHGQLQQRSFQLQQPQEGDEGRQVLRLRGGAVKRRRARSPADGHGQQQQQGLEDEEEEEEKQEAKRQEEEEPPVTAAAAPARRRGRPPRFSLSAGQQEAVAAMLGPGQPVEVMNGVDEGEQGLQGAWFSARVIEGPTEGGYLRVEYHELLEEDGETRLQEWYPLDTLFDRAVKARGIQGWEPFSHAPCPDPCPSRLQLTAPTAATCGVHVPGLGFLVRPEPPAHVSRQGQLAAVDLPPGTRVDALVDDGYWESFVQ